MAIAATYIHSSNHKLYRQDRSTTRVLDGGRTDDTYLKEFTSRALTERDLNLWSLCGSQSQQIMPTLGLPPSKTLVRNIMNYTTFLSYYQYVLHLFQVIKKATKTEQLYCNHLISETYSLPHSLSIDYCTLAVMRTKTQKMSYLSCTVCSHTCNSANSYIACCQG